MGGCIVGRPLKFCWDLFASEFCATLERGGDLFHEQYRPTRS